MSLSTAQLKSPPKTSPTLTRVSFFIFVAVISFLFFRIVVITTYYNNDLDYGFTISTWDAVKYCFFAALLVAFTIIWPRPYSVRFAIFWGLLVGILVTWGTGLVYALAFGISGYLLGFFPIICILGFCILTTLFGPRIYEIFERIPKLSFGVALLLLALMLGYNGFARNLITRTGMIEKTITCNKISSSTSTRLADDDTTSSFICYSKGPFIPLGPEGKKWCNDTNRMIRLGRSVGISQTFLGRVSLDSFIKQCHNLNDRRKAV
jgi:hypothetical protein